jgi:hypothetical protein
MIVGEAKRKSKTRNKLYDATSKTISIPRFDLYTIGTRVSWGHHVLAEDLSYWSLHDERVLGLVCRDRTDDDYGWIVFVRDRVGRFRGVLVGHSLPSAAEAEAALRQKIAQVVAEGNLEELGVQGDEPNTPFDVLSVAPGTDPARLHPFFRVLSENIERAPARATIKEIAPWLAPTDPHFIREFQGEAFNQRLWELYLWAAFRDFGIDVTQPEAPDFHCNRLGFEFTVEATTVAPSLTGLMATHPDPKTPHEMREFLLHYMPMKFGSALTSKLNKKDASGRSYWERGEGAGQPFVLAIADYHKPGGDGELGSMTYSGSALWLYLYGQRLTWEHVDGKLLVHAAKTGNHSYLNKTVPSGFFDLPGAEHVSAVISTNAGTLAKFDRMGVIAGFSPPNTSYYRSGLRHDPTPDSSQPTPFFEQITENSKEGWADEIQVYHNPRALHPIPREVLQGAAHHYFEGGKQYTIGPSFRVLGSYTTILRSVPDNEWEETVRDEEEKELRRTRRR